MCWLLRAIKLRWIFMGRITKSLPYMYLNEHLDTWYFLLIKSCKHDSFNVVMPCWTVRRLSSFITELWHKDKGLNKDNKCILLSLPDESMLLWNPEFIGSKKHISITAYQLSGSMFICSSNETTSETAVVIGVISH